MATDDRCFLTIAEAGRLIKSKALSPVELVEAFLARIEALDPLINSYITVVADQALAAANAAERDITAGRYLGPLHGIPFGLKDVIDTKDVATTSCSRLHAVRIPTEDATCVARLKESGAILLGKLSCQEFASNGPCFDLPWPPARNPWNTDCSPAGSSSGSGAAVAAGLAMAALGTDTGGSVRNPSSFCGLAGIKPTYGRVSRKGVIANSWTLDHVGPMTWTVEDCALMLQAIAGYDPDDPGSADKPVPDFTSGLEGGIKGLKVGLVRHFYEEDLPANGEVIGAMSAASQVFSDLGARVEEIRLPPMVDYLDPRHIIGAAEMFAVHEQDFREYAPNYGEMIRLRIASGALISAADYIQAQRKRGIMIKKTEKVLANYDVLLTANHYGPAGPLAGALRKAQTGLSITGVFNITGHPALALCNGFSESGLPLSMQIVGRYFNEATVFRVGQAYERATPWRGQRPPLNR